MTKMPSRRPHARLAKRSGRKQSPSYQVLEPRQLLAAAPIITEFLASNDNGLVNDNGQASDWIEIYNAGDQSIDLAGYTLTDDAAETDKWTFPSVNLAAGSYLVVFANDDADPSTGSDLYTGFKLSASGEYVGFYDPAGVVVSEFGSGGTQYPGQFADVSYGVRFDTGNFDQVSFFATPTPGAPNINPVEGLVERVVSDTDTGFYNATIQVALSTVTPGATIRYTIDGSTPSTTNGLVYSGPISVSATTNIRAVATKANYLSVHDRTWSYIYLDDVLTQSNDGSPPPGWPSEWNTNDVDYGIDPDVIAVEGTQDVKDALLAIPTWSITTDLDNLFDSDTGIYSNALQDGRDWERPASVELLNPDGSEGFQVNAGIRIRGGFSRNDPNPKHAFRLFFRGEYGDSKLEYPVHGANGTDVFDKIDLRTAQNYSWSFYGDASNNFIVDRLARLSQNALGEPTTQSSWLHLYLNGQYWGLFETQERSEANYAATYFGGSADDYDVIKPERGPYQNIATDGNFDAYEQLFQLALARSADGRTPNFENYDAYMEAQGLNPDGSRNPNFDVLLDVDNLITYMTVILSTGNFDAPISQFLGDNRLNNYFAIRDRTGDEGFRFFIHDSEHGMRDVNENRNGPYNHENFESGVEFFNPQWLHQQLMANDEYRIRFADKIYDSYFNDGPMTLENQLARLDAVAGQIDQAIIAESARWGDSKRANNPRLRSHWVNAVSNLRNNYTVNRNDVFLDQLRNTILQLKGNSGNYDINVDAPLLPSVDAPDLLIDGTVQSGGIIDVGSELRFASTAPEIWYTLDGNDPRLVGGGISPDALLYENSTVDTTVVAAGSSWRYSDTGTNFGTAWQESAFNDSAWSSGNAELGYGDGDETTVVSFGSDANNKHPATYFRKTFNVSGGENVNALLRLRRDDGAIVYLNGVEIARNNLPGGAINFDTFASRNANDDGNTWLEFQVDPGLIVAGDNTLAIGIHQRSGDSSDITFDAEFILSAPTAPPVVLNGTTEVNARALAADGTWSPIHSASYVLEEATQANIRISEIHYNPHDPSAAEIAAGFDDNDEFEFLEVVNAHPTGTVNLSGMQLGNGLTFTFGNLFLDPGERAIVVENTAAFAFRYGSSIVPAGQWTGGLSNRGETLELLDDSGAEVMSVTWADDGLWTVAADGKGSSLVLEADTSTSSDRLGKHYSWRASVEYGGTPGAAAAAVSGVVVNEILAHTDAPALDAIELFNTTSGDIDVGGWYLGDSGSDPFKYQIPAGTILAAGQFVVFDESDFNPNPTNPGPNDFALSSLGDQVYLTRNVGGVPAFEEVVEFRATFNGQSIGRVPDGSGRFLPMSELTLGSGNDSTIVGPLFISEVNYHPEDPSAAAVAIDPTIGSKDLEFIEIKNPGLDPIDLSQWRLRGELDFDFASGTIAAGEAVVVVTFDPLLATNASRLSAFRTHYGIDNSVQIFGTVTSDNLNNSFGRVSLQTADEPPATDPTVTPWVLADELVYDDLSPWSQLADGAGPSLHRVASGVEGTLASNWTGVTASPGEYFGNSTAPVIDIVTINDGENQRSAVDKLVLVFGGAVDIDADAFSIVQLSDGDALPTGISVTSSFTCVKNGDTTVTLTFDDATRNSAGVLEDGNYQLTVDGSKVRRAGTGLTLGTDFVYGDSADEAFFALYGDNNGDRTVNVFDLLAFRQTYLSSTGDTNYNANLDYGADGRINVLDLLRFRQNYRKALPFV